MINRTVLTGRLTRDPELRYTASGTPVASFTLAVDRNFANKEGKREADFINCVIWRKPAEIFSQYNHKGSLVGVDGRLQTRSYENQQGVRVYITEVVVEDFSFLESKGANTASSASNNDYGQANPSQNQNDNSIDDQLDPFASNGQPIDISDDDLPF